MGHSIDVTDCYYKPTEKEILEDSLKAIDAFNVDKNSNKHLEKENELLRIKNESNEYAIKSKLQEKDDVYIALSDQVMMLMEKVQKLESAAIKYFNN